MNISYYDLYYTVIKTRDKSKDIDIQYENDENDYINFEDIIAIHFLKLNLVKQY